MGSNSRAIIDFYFPQPHLLDCTVGRSFMLIPKSVFVSLPRPLHAFRLHEVSCCVQKNCNMHLRWRLHRHAGTHHEQTWIMYDASEPTHPVYHDCWTYISLIPVATIAPVCCSILAGRACGSTMWLLTLWMSPSELNSKNIAIQGVCIQRKAD